MWALLRPVSRDARGHGRQTLRAVEKLPQRSVTNKGRKKQGRCLRLNEAKNGKRVWCRSGTQPAFSKWGKLNFPTSSLLKQLSKQLGPPPFTARARALRLFQPPAGKPERGCILPASLSTSLPELPWTTGREKLGEGETPSNFFFDRWASRAR